MPRPGKIRVDYLNDLGFSIPSVFSIASVGIGIMSGYSSEYYGGFWEMVDQSYMSDFNVLQAMVLAYGIPLFLLLGILWMIDVLIRRLEDL